MKIIYLILLISAFFCLFILVEYILSKNKWNLLYESFNNINSKGDRITTVYSRLKFGANLLKGTHYPLVKFKIYNNGLILTQPLHFCCHKKIFIPYSKINEFISINGILFYSYKILIKLNNNQSLTLLINYDVGKRIKKIITNNK